MRTKQGIVVSTGADKTIKVQVVRYKNHPLYKKKFAVTTNFLAHDPENTHKVGDEVTIYETRPISKRKSWTIVEPTKK